MTVWELLALAVQDLPERFARQDILKWFADKHPEVHQPTVSAHIQYATSNAPIESRAGFAVRTPLITRVARGEYVRYARDTPEPVPSTTRLLAFQPFTPRAEPAQPNHPAVDEPAAATDRTYDIVLVSCGRAKRDRPSAAADLYTSPGFASRRTIAESQGERWFVLSAEHGLVQPYEWLAPYDLALVDASRAYRDAWGQWVLARLTRIVGDLNGISVLLLAPSAYADPIGHRLRAAGASVVAPLIGLRQGEQIAWMAEQARQVPATTRSEHAATSAPPPTVGRSVLGSIKNFFSGTSRTERQATAPPPHPTPVAAEPSARTSHARHQELIAALLEYRRTHYELPQGGQLRFAHTAEANALLASDPFAFLLGVVFDHGIKAERAWEAPMELVRRMGHLDPWRMRVEPDEVARAVTTPPTLHRFPDIMSRAVVSAADIVCSKYDGDASRLWAPGSTASEVDARFREFRWVGQKKAAMAVELLVSRMGVDIADLHGSDVAYDVHIRRVFLRTGLVDHDSVGEVVAAARRLYPERPGYLDGPTWSIGRGWCHSTNPDCPNCPLTDACPKLTSRSV
ncbi:hypothetical protein IPV09_08560 [Tessaracoccus sp. SD287]|uniref:DUF6884 domain-containing protein n=1 Tax=Tessaracoccus sp. SD287 TaxID=2782008 RepID=UPI001A9581C1|nr:DUF6884 domain-containing protein [Tessaracoccus sp. SD287]MBO1031387.1 hypothetical protein [Tessaracoccus sp. SD287]